MADSRLLFGLVVSGAFALASNASALPPSTAKPADVTKPAKPAQPAKPANTVKPGEAPQPAEATKPSDGAAEDRAALASRLVVLERAGKPLGLGIVLNGDGRIVAALSAIGDGRHADAHYADGNSVPVRIGHADRAHDLALLVPESSKHKLGLKASRENGPPPHTALGSFSVNGNKAAVGPMLTPAPTSAVTGNDGKPFPEALAFSAEPAATGAGGPLVDANGEVVAIVTRACEKKAGPRCATELVGTPVGIVREFLRSAPKTAALPTASLGVELTPDDTGAAHGLRVTAVRGPAAAAGLHPGADARVADVIVALDSVPVTTNEAFARLLDDHAVGDVVDVLILGSGRYRHVSLVVAATAH